jgi:hypothetical protein
MLPLSSPYTRSSKPDNGIKNISTVNNSVVLTLIWFAVSIIAVISGFWHCRSNAFNYSLICDSTRCLLEYPMGIDLPSWKGQSVDIDEFNKLAIAKENIMYSDSVSLDENNEIVDTSEMTSRAISKLGLTTQIKYKQYNDPKNPTVYVTNTVLFPPIDMGRRKARGALRKLKDYTAGRTTALNQQHGRMVTAPGVLGFIFGIVSIILSLVLGTWKDDKSRRPWARGRKRAD